MGHVLVHPTVRHDPSILHASGVWPRQHVWEPSCLIGLDGLVEHGRLGITEMVPFATMCLVLLRRSREVVMACGKGRVRREQSATLIRLVVVVLDMDPWRDGAHDTIVVLGGLRWSRGRVLVVHIDGRRERIAHRRLHGRASARAERAGWGGWRLRQEGYGDRG